MVAVALIAWSGLHVLAWWRVEAAKGRRREWQVRLRRGAWLAEAAGPGAAGRQDSTHVEQARHDGIPCRWRPWVRYCG